MYHKDTRNTYTQDCDVDSTLHNSSVNPNGNRPPPYDSSTAPPIPAPRGLPYDAASKSVTSTGPYVSSMQPVNPPRTQFDRNVVMSNGNSLPRPNKAHRRPVSVHEQDFYKNEFSIPIKLDPFEKSRNRNRRGWARPLSLHEQPISLTLSQASETDEQNNLFSPDYQSRQFMAASSTTSNSSGSQNTDDKQAKGDFQNVNNNERARLQEIYKVPNKPPENKPCFTSAVEAEIGIAVATSAAAAGDRGLPVKDYDCAKAMAELQDLKKQQLESKRKHDAAMKEAEHMSNNYKTLKEKHEDLIRENNGLAMQCNDTRIGKERSDREVEDLKKYHEDDKKEIAELRQKLLDLVSRNSSTEIINMLDTMQMKYNNSKLEVESLKSRRHDDCAQLARTQSSIDLLQTEVKRLQEKNDEFNRDKTKLQKINNGLQKHFTSQLQNFHNERDKLRQELMETQNKLSRHLLYDNHEKLVRDMGKLKQERDAVLHEYSTVMEERNTVYKEMDQLEEKLSSSEKKLEGSVKEKKSMSDQLETFKREIASALQDRDHALKELNEVKEKYSSTVEGIKHEAEKRIKREDSSRDGSDASSKDIATAREIDNLRRELERVRAELVEAQNEVVLAKNRRDWAFGERDKIVRERESVRTLCDKLRRERDSAVTQFMEAVKDSDELKTSKSEALRQLKEIQERFESLTEKVEKETGDRPDGYHLSKDSAIDTDLTEWYTETVHIDLTSTPGDLGFNLSPSEDNLMVISSIKPGTVAYQKLRVNDIAVKINNMDLNAVNSSAILESARHSGNLVSVAVKRKKLVGSEAVKPVVIQSHGSDPGVQVATGMYVSRINPGSPAAREGSLMVGDRLLAVNGVSVDSLGLSQVMKRIQSSSTQVCLSVLKFPSSPAMSSLFLSSPDSSGHMMSSSGVSSPGAMDSASPPITDDLWRMSVSLDEDAASKVVNTTIRSSGSQTDSLDSPPTSARNQMLPPAPSSGGGGARGMYIKSPNADKSKDSLLNRAKKFAKKVVDRSERCQSMVYDSSTISDQSVIDELNDIVNQYSQPAQQQVDNSNKPPKSGNSRRRQQQTVKDRNSGGTWPRCGPVLDDNKSGFQPVIPRRAAKDRTPLDVMYHHPVSVVSASGVQSAAPPIPSLPDPVHRMPPEPPQRNDSFRRSASITHSPQSSDSTVKSVQSHSAISQSTSPSKLYAASLQKSSCTDAAFPPSTQPPSRKLPLAPNQDPSVLVGGSQALAHGYQQQSYTNGTTSNTGSSADEAGFTSPPDYTVVSGPEIAYPRRGRRPRTAPVPKNREDKQKMSRDGSQSSMEASAAFKPPVKPSFIDVRPSYFVRNNNSTSGVPAASTSNSSYVTGAVLTSQQQQAAVTTAVVTSPRDKPPTGPLTARHHTAQYSPYVGSNHGTYNVARQSHLSTPSPINIPPPPVPGFSPPPAYNGAHNFRRLNTPSPSPSQQSNQTYETSTNSDGEFCSYGPKGVSRNVYIPGYPEQNMYVDGISTLPTRSRPQHSDRIRIPSTPSMLSSTQSSVGKISTSSLSDRGSPISPLQLYSRTEYVNTSMPNTVSRPPLKPGDTRSITIERGNEQLGIQIDTGRCGAIFVSSVSENSLAFKAGLMIGDQLLEVCGINMRMATRELVSRVLSQVGASIRMLVQYNPDKYDESSSSSDSEPEPSIGTDASHIRSGSQISAEEKHVRSGSQRNTEKTHVLAGSQHSTENHTRSGSQRSSEDNHMRTGSQDNHMRTSSQDNHMRTGSQENHLRTGSQENHMRTGSQENHMRTGSQRSSEDSHMRTGSQDNHMRTGSQRSSEDSHMRTGSQRSSEDSHMRTGSQDNHMRTGSQRSSEDSHMRTGSQDNHVRTGSQRSASHASQRSGSGRSAGSGISGIHRPQPQKLMADASSTSDTPTSMSPVHAKTKGEDSRFSGQIRFVFYKKNNPEDHVGFDMVGGNAVGIFVDRVHLNGIVPSGPTGLNTGDQILEFNGISFRDLTAEQASLEVSKPVDSVTIRAQYNYTKYKNVENQPGDSLFVKALFDYCADKEGELSFKRDDILYVENTMYNGLQGVWKAWLLDEHGAKIQHGTVASKNKLEDEYVLRRSMSDIGEDELKGNRRGSGSANRRSFFRKMKHHRNNSKDSRELTSFSDASINSDYDDGVMLTYERVERMDNKVWRPVIILGPLAEALINKITSESPDRYSRCLPEKVQTSISTLQAGQHDGVFIDFRTHSDGHFECITVDGVKSIMKNSRHGMLNVGPEAIERLHKVHIYPIVLFVKHENAKQIREFRDSRFLPEKISSKLAKELFQVNKDVEHHYKRHFSDIIQGECLAYQCVKIKNSIEKEQKKTVWVPSGSL